MPKKNKRKTKIKHLFGRRRTKEERKSKIFLADEERKKNRNQTSFCRRRTKEERKSNIFSPKKKENHTSFCRRRTKEKRKSNILVAEEEARKLEDPNIHFVSERRGGGGGGDVRGESKRHVVVIFFPMTHTKAQYSCTEYNVVLQSLSIRLSRW